MSTQGLFIVFEGGDGGGKSTQISTLLTWLHDQGYQAITTREPGGTHIGEQMRAIFLDTAHDIDPVTEAYVLATARSSHVREVIQPALDTNDVVLCDRFIDSSLMYQGMGRGLGFDLVRAINAPAIGDLTPTLTFILDIDPMIGLHRTEQMAELDRLEMAGMAFHQRVREEYQALAKANPERYIVIDASQDPDTVFAHIKTVMQSILPALPAG